jgi:hypothetical protein
MSVFPGRTGTARAKSIIMEFFPSPDKVWFAFRKSIWIGLGLLVVWVLWEAALHAFFKWFNEQLTRRVGPMTATIIKWTKNHPLYFLMAIMITYCFFVIVGAQLFVSKEPIENKIPDRAISEPVISTLPQKLSKSPSENIPRPETDLSPKSLSPGDIKKTINMAPMLQQQEIAKNYIGLKVTWEGNLYNIGKFGEDKIMIIILIGGEHIMFYVISKDYPGLGLLKRGAPIKVEGVIDSVEFFIKLKDIKMISY